MGMSLCFPAGEKIVAMSGALGDRYDLRYHSQPLNRDKLLTLKLPTGHINVTTKVTFQA
jgi:hypothetical protein